MTRSTARQSEPDPIRILYKGPNVHERIITKAHLERSGVAFGKTDEDFELRWAPNPGRVSVVLPEMTKGAQEQVLEILSQDPTFEIKQGSEVISEAAPNAGQTLADGSNAASGEGGSPELAEAIGMAQGSAGDASAGTSGTSGGVGGSTAGA
jgi:hypothetical protein